MQVEIRIANQLLSVGNRPGDVLSSGQSERVANAGAHPYQCCVLDELIRNDKGLWLGVERRVVKGSLELTFRLKGSSPCVLHWGTASRRASSWQLPVSSLWPEGSTLHDTTAVQTPFKPDSEGGRLSLRFPKEAMPPFLVFDLLWPETNKWENNRGRDFWIGMTEPGPSPATALEAHLAESSQHVPVQTLTLNTGDELATATVHDADQSRLVLVTNAAGPLLLHWGVQDRARSRWKLPSAAQRPAGTKDFDAQAVRTPFEEREGLCWLILAFSSAEAPTGIGLVLFQSGAGHWLKPDGHDLFLRVSAVESAESPLSDLMAEIVDGEMGKHGWTLMHRFNLCHNLIEQSGDDRAAWATLFIWLRYSAIRQLDWQRNYNTKPSELSHAQERLTAKLAESYARHPGQRDLVRLMLGCVGRGGDGQRIRDEILQIMHRHHIKEVGGTWMEQWHQKLHNNTTPDDIVICEAYLAFFRADGHLEAYDQQLLQGGVTRERLAGFERPITQNPEWHPHLKDGLIHDFEHYLQLLRSVHAGTDLDTAAQSGRHLLDGDASDALGFVQWHFRDAQTNVVELVERITAVRRGLNNVLIHESDSSRVKDGLYLDLALEEALRTVIERQLHSGFEGDVLVTLIGLVQENLLLGQDDHELAQCGRELASLPQDGRFSPDWSLRAKAAVDRLRRAAESITDMTYQQLQPTATRLGQEFDAAEWTVTLFSEEIVRGRPVFVLSMLLQQLDPILRKGANVGDWQVISPSRAVGEVVVMEELRPTQGRKFARPTVIIADKVHGDEEPPEGVCGIITSGSVDLVSHVAVRARNANLLFATCFDAGVFEQLKKLEGSNIVLTVTPSGDVKFADAREAIPGRAKRKTRSTGGAVLPEPALRVLRRDEFVPGQVGGKSWRIRELAGKLSDTFHTPRSVALPFGVFEAVLASKVNKTSAQTFKSLLRQLNSEPETKLAELRECILGLQLPDKLMRDLRDALEREQISVGQAAASLSGNQTVELGGDRERVDLVAARIKQVWASLWNDRAYASREANGLAHDSVSMAVLIHEVVEADYAFVIHTVNPATGNRGEMYAEVVRGLGETLVGNYPGRAMSFVVDRAGGNATVLAYPSKSIALHGSGLIFRSDSNAEDLEGYAGAGLYDSVMIAPFREERLDYTGDRLVWDAIFQKTFLSGIVELGLAVERAFGGPQDIEGVWRNGEWHVVQTRPQVGLQKA